MINTNVKEKLLEKGVKIEKKEEVTTSLPDGIIFSKDNDMNKFLFNKAIEILKIQGDSRIKIGEIFENVKQKLGENKDGNVTYIKWLDHMGTNKMTAIRYRNRFLLHKKIKTNEGKNLVSVIGDNIISDIIKPENISTMVEKLNDGISRKELMLLIKRNKSVISLGENKTRKEFKRISSKYKKIDIEKLSDKEKNKIHNLLEELENVIDLAIK